MSTTAYSEDTRLSFGAGFNWRTGGKQAVIRSELREIQPVRAIEGTPSRVDFEITGPHPIAFSENTYFTVAGHFEARAATEGSEWTQLGPGDWNKVKLAPNWFDLQIKTTDVYHKNRPLKTSEEGPNVGAHLNASHYWFMDKAVKRALCVEPCHPGNGIPSTLAKWNTTIQTDEWGAYAATVFTGRGFSFNWRPLFVWPFYQSTNFVYDQHPPQVVPFHLPDVGPLQVRFYFHDSTNNPLRIFNRNDQRNYRFVLERMYLVVEDLVLSPGIDRTLFSGGRRVLNYPGVSRLVRSQEILQASNYLEFSFKKIRYPEALYIVVLPRKVISDDYSYSTAAADEPFFEQHNVQEVKINWGGKDFSIKEPHFGQVTNDLYDTARFHDYSRRGPLGVFTNQALITRTLVADGFRNTPFPHLYFELTLPGDRNVYVPPLAELQHVTKPDDLTVTLRFVANEAPKEVVIQAQALYFDVCMQLDLRDKTFSSPYNIK